MPTPRDQLIADWRKRLAAASEAPQELTSRAAWLARLRRRLYQFLLSLYGEGDWNAPEGAKRALPGPANTADTGTACLSPGFAGKPAKDLESIRAVLQSVAGAAETTLTAGPLAAGIDREEWVVVASISRGLDPELAAAALLAKGIVSRLIVRPRDTTVEVRGYHEPAAVELIGAQQARLRIRSRAAPSVVSPRPVGPIGDFQWSLLFLGLGVGPVVAVLVLLLLGLTQPGSIDLPTAIQLIWLVAYVWLGSLGLIGLIYLFVGLRRKARPRSGQ